MEEEQITVGEYTDIERIEGAPLLYINSVSVRVTPYEIMIRLSQSWAAEEDKLVMKDAAMVVMSPQHAKAFSEILAKNVRAWERVFGPIQVGPIEGFIPESADPPTAPRRPSSRSRSGARKKGS